MKTTAQKQSAARQRQASEQAAATNERIAEQLDLLAQSEAAGLQTIRADRVMIRATAEHAAALARSFRCASSKRGATMRKRQELRFYPVFVPGVTSTAEYVSEYMALNGSCTVAGSFDGLFDLLSMTSTPCALYENGATDYTPIETTDDDEQAAIVTMAATVDAAPAHASSAATEQAETTPDASAIIAASMAIGTAQATAASQQTDASDAQPEELATVDAPDHTDDASATPAAHTPHATADAVAQADTPTTKAPNTANDNASDCTEALKTQAHANDYTDPLKTQATGHAESSSSAPTIPAPSAAQFIGDIPQSLARGAFSGTSFSPERRGDSARDGYAGTMAEDWAFFEQHATKGGTLDKLPEEFARYRARLAGLYRAWLASSSRCVSSFIVGPANFPAARMNKRADIAHRRLGEYLDTREAARRAVVRNLRPDLRPIMSGDADAVERLAAELSKAEREHENMKRANATIRKHAKAGAAHQVAALMELGYTEEQAARLVTPPPHLAYCGPGFASFTLTNSSARIRNMRERLAHLQRCKAADTTEATGADGVRMQDDPPANRVRLYFPGKPAASVRDALKSAGFRWAPSLEAWQAYRNRSTLETARHMAGINADQLKPAETQDDTASATPAAHTPQATADAVAQADTPATEATTPANDDASDYTGALKTQAQACDYTAPLKTQEPEARTSRENAQKVSSKNGEWIATLYKTWDNLHGLIFQAINGPELHSAHDSQSARMRALQGMARGEWEPAIGETYTGDTAAAAEAANRRGDGYEYRASRNDYTLLERRPKLPSATAAAPDFRALEDYPENLQGEALAQWFTTATSSQQAAEHWGDALDHINGGRIIETRNALRALGWDAEPYTWPLTLNGAPLRVDCWTVGAGRNVARVTWCDGNGNKWADDWTMHPDTLAAYVHAMAHPGPDAPTPSDTTPPETTAPNYTEAPETQAATAPANPAPRASKPKAARPWPQRNFKPAGAERIADESGAMAWECFIHQPRAERWAVLAYAGKASKPAHHYGYATEAAARDFVRRFAAQIEARQQAKQQHDAERRAKLAQPHGLAVGAVPVSSWGYDQTNVDFYEVTKVIGARTVEVREIAAEAVHTGDMTGRCVPVPGRYTSEPMRRLVGANGYVNVRQARFGHACELKPQIVAGVKVYPSQSWSSYA